MRLKIKINSIQINEQTYFLKYNTRLYSKQHLGKENEEFPVRPNIGKYTKQLLFSFAADYLERFLEELFLRFSSLMHSCKD